MHDLGLSPEDTGGSITFIGEDPIFPSKHRLGACVSIPIMAGAAGIANIWRQRSGRGQDLTLDLTRALCSPRLMADSQNHATSTACSTACASEQTYRSYVCMISANRARQGQVLIDSCVKSGQSLALPPRAPKH